MRSQGHVIRFGTTHIVPERGLELPWVPHVDRPYLCVEGTHIFLSLTAIAQKRFELYIFYLPVEVH